jgi:hypothetical protein
MMKLHKIFIRFLLKELKTIFIKHDAINIDSLFVNFTGSIQNENILFYYFCTYIHINR